MHMKTTLRLLGLLLLIPAGVSAQPCTAPTGTSDTVTSGRAPTIQWTWPDQVPASATDPTLVPHRVNGVSVEVVNAAGGVVQAKRDYALGTPVTCPDGSKGYSVLLASGVPKGSYVARVLGWNYALDASGNPTTTRQEGPMTARPFVAIDPVFNGPPVSPANLKVVR